MKEKDINWIRDAIWQLYDIELLECKLTHAAVNETKLNLLKDILDVLRNSPVTCLDNPDPSRNAETP